MLSLMSPNTKAAMIINAVFYLVVVSRSELRY